MCLMGYFKDCKGILLSILPVELLGREEIRLRAHICN